MSTKSSPSTPTPLQGVRPGIDEDDDDDEEEEELNQIQISSSSSSREKELQIVSLEAFRLPDDWFVKEKPRLSGRIDRYYYEPGTGRKFCSLVSVQRYLAGDTRDFHITERMKSKNKNTIVTKARTRKGTSFFQLPNDWIVKEKPRDNIKYAGVIYKCYIEPGTGRRFRSLRAVERYLTGENACTAITKPSVKSGFGKQRAPGAKRCLKAVQKRSRVAEEDRITLKELKLAIKSRHSKKSGSGKKINLGMDNRASMLDFSRPPAKVSWVLTGPGGFWSPFLDDSIVPESVKLKWSEEFVLSIHDGDIMH